MLFSVLFVLLFIGCEEGLEIKGADRAVFAMVGEEVILNCSVDSRDPASDIEEVSWKRTDQDILVLLYQDSEVLSDSSHDNYRGRVEFFITEIPKGNFSLKLKDVRLEDKGEFLCEVHTRNLSARTTVVLQRLGFSGFHIWILVLCFCVVLISVGLGVLIFILQRKEDSSGGVVKLHASLIICPNILMCAAFIAWSTEGTLAEIVTCSVVSIIRPLMLVKTSPYLRRFPKLSEKAVKTLVVPVYYSLIALAACSVLLKNARWAQAASEHVITVLAGLAVVCLISSVVFAANALQMHSAVGLELCSGALLGLFLARSKYGFDNSIQIPSILPPIIMLIMMVLSLQTHGFQNKPFECRHIVLSSVIVIGFGLVEIGVFVLLGISMRNFDRTWILPLEALLHLILWVSVVCVLHRRGSRRLGCFSKHRETGSLCCAVVVAVLASVFGALCVHYVNEHMGNKKDGKGYMALTALLHVSAATSLFKHPDDLPNIPHCVIYIFGAVGLNTVNSIALVLELCLKAGSGARTVEDLRVIVLPSETLFIAGWLVLQIYGVCVAIRHRRKGGQGRTVCQVHQEMEGLSDTVL